MTTNTETPVADVERLLAMPQLGPLGRGAAAEIERLRAQVEAMREAATDALSGWRYIRQQHGDLYGVGWDRVERALVAALSGGAK